MFLYNQTRKILIVSDLKIAESIIDKSLGLHRRGNLKSLLFKTRFGIHTYLLKKPIDVIILDNNNQVVKSKTVSPNSLFFYNPIYSKVLELPKDTIKNTHTKIGDIIQIRNSRV